MMQRNIFNDRRKSSRCEERTKKINLTNEKTKYSRNKNKSKHFNLKREKNKILNCIIYEIIYFSSSIKEF